MKDKKILINSANLVKDFVLNASKVEDSVKLFSESGREVNGKSIMGIFSLDVTKPLYVKTAGEHADFTNFLKKVEV